MTPAVIEPEILEEPIPKSIEGSYRPELADDICAQLASGVPLAKLCKMDGYPCVRTVYKWMRVYPPFLVAYQSAKEEAADMLVDEMLDIADDARNDWMERNGERVVDHEHIQRSRLRIDTRKWVASKLKPKRYGEKLDHTLTGGDGGPVNLRCAVTFVKAAPILTHVPDSSSQED